MFRIPGDQCQIKPEKRNKTNNKFPSLGYLLNNSYPLELATRIANLNKLNIKW